MLQALALRGQVCLGSRNSHTFTALHQFALKKKLPIQTSLGIIINSSYQAFTPTIPGLASRVTEKSPLPFPPRPTGNLQIECFA